MANFFTPKKRTRRGLSALQRFILSLGKKQGGEVLARDVLIHYYGFTPFRNPELVKPEGMVFRKSDVGFVRYNSKTVTVCKSFNRIVKRGLAYRIHSGIRLKRSGRSG